MSVAPVARGRRAVADGGRGRRGRHRRRAVRRAAARAPDRPVALQEENNRRRDEMTDAIGFVFCSALKAGKSSFSK